MTDARNGSTQEPNDDAQPSASRLATFDYIKSNLYRVIHVDGIVGGPGPRGTIFLNLFSERLPIPKQQVFDVGSGGQLGKEHVDKRVVRQSIVREVESAISMDLKTARAVFEWLGGMIASLERQNIKEQKRSDERRDPKGI